MFPELWFLLAEIIKTVHLQRFKRLVDKKKEERKTENGLAISADFSSRGDARPDPPSVTLNTALTPSIYSLVTYQLQLHNEGKVKTHTVNLENI